MGSLERGRTEEAVSIRGTPRNIYVAEGHRLTFWHLHLAGWKQSVVHAGGGSASCLFLHFSFLVILLLEEEEEASVSPTPLKRLKGLLLGSAEGHRKMQERGLRPGQRLPRVDLPALHLGQTGTDLGKIFGRLLTRGLHRMTNILVPYS